MIDSKICDSDFAAPAIVSDRCLRLTVSNVRYPRESLAFNLMFRYFALPAIQLITQFIRFIYFIACSVQTLAEY